jgi:homocysteine S-methyltransferase
MAHFRKALPQIEGDFFLTDGGIETTLIFLEGIELPDLLPSICSSAETERQL